MFSSFQNFGSLAVFMVVVVGGGLVIGLLTSPGEWYADLKKPSFNPPNWIFGPVWAILYLFIAIVGWRLWQGDPSSLAMKMWYAQLILNFAWSPVFFVAHRIGAAFGIITLLFITIAAFIITVSNQDWVLASLFLPYAIWVGFALALNGAILFLNARHRG
jgi:tryptophan-rich sensory protein